MESIIQQEKECFICHSKGASDSLEMHHIFFGSNRKKAEQDGMKVWLCGCKCHRLGPESVHQCRDTDLWLKRIGQEAWEARYGSREDFRKRYGKSYIE